MIKSAANSLGRRKMTSKFFLFFSVALILITLWAVNRPKESSDAVGLFSKINRESIQELIIKKKNQKDVKVIWDGDRWQLVTPVKELADQYSVESFVNWLLDVRLLRLTQKNAWKEQASPMDELLGEIKMFTKKGLQINLSIGLQRSVEGYFYLTQLNDPNIYLGTDDWEKKISRRSYLFRNSNLLPEEGEVTELTIEENGKETLNLKASGVDWLVKVKNEFVLANQKKVNRLLFELKSLTANGFFAENPNQNEKRKFGLEQGVLMIQLRIKNSTTKINTRFKNWRVWISKEIGHQVYALTSQRSAIVGLNAIQIGKFRSKSLLDFVENPAHLTKGL